MRDLHRKIFQRLMAAWLTISLIIGGGVFFYSWHSLDQQLVAVANSESEQLAQASLSLMQPNEQDVSALRALTSDFVRRHFIMVRIYGPKGSLLVEEINPRHQNLVAALGPAMPPQKVTLRRRISLGQDNVVQVMAPLWQAPGQLAGYLEGALLIEPETMARLHREMAMTLGWVLAVVLLTTLTLYPVILMLNRDLLRTSRDLLKGNLELMAVLGSAVAKRDSETNSHNYRVTFYALRLAEAVGQPPLAIRDLIAGAFLHDVGKIGIRDQILLKPGQLSEEEFAIMQTHVTLGKDILSKSTWLQRARDVVEFHHEKFDGSGYPQGRKGQEIPLNARIFAVVDVFDALTSQRPYKAPLAFDVALGIVREGSGRHFDPTLVDAFGRIAASLYQEIGQTSDEAVEARLTPLIESYFLISDKRGNEAPA